MPPIQFIEDNLHHIQNIQQADFDLQSELSIGIDVVIAMGGNPIYFEKLRLQLQQLEIENVNRTQIVEWVQNNSFTKKELCLIIFCWGIYFSVFRQQNRNYITNLSDFFNVTGDLFFDDLWLAVQNTNPVDQNSIQTLVRSFNYKRDFYIPGVGYSYFTKLFYFFSQNNRLLILDKWLTIAYLYLLRNDEDNQYQNYLRQAVEGLGLPHIYTLNNIGRFNRRFAQNYANYIFYITEISIYYELLPGKLETFLFGWNLNDNVARGYVNPRVFMSNFFNGV